MKSRTFLWPVLAMSIILLGCDSAVAPEKSVEAVSQEDGAVFASKKGGTTIKDGVLLDSEGQVITVGYNNWGYNYQARMFNGFYCDSYRDAAWCLPYKDVRLMMKWNDAWLSNMDREGDGLLDRHYGFPDYIGSGAWLTNHQSGEYEQDGKTCKWNYFVKIVAAPADATVVDGFWVSADGTEIGEVIWGDFAIIQQVENDACAGIHGVQYINDAPTGFGFF